MDQRTKLKLEMITAWSGVIFIVFYPIFWTYMAKVQPPVPYSFSPQQVQDHYVSNRQGVMVGMAMSGIIGGAWLTFTAQLTVVLKRIEGDAPVFTIISMLGGVLAGWALIFTPMAWMMPALRVDGNPQVAQAFSDFAYLLFNGTFIISTLQAVTHGVLGLLDKSPYPAFPKWASWLAIICGLMFFLVGQTPFVQSGALSIEGWFAGWIPGSAYFVWTIVTTYYLIKDVRRRQRVLATS